MSLGARGEWRQHGWRQHWRRGLGWTALTVTTAGVAYFARWVRYAVEARTLGRVPSVPAARDPAAARAQQRQADTALWRWVEGHLVRPAITPFRVRPTLRPLRVLNLDHGPGGIACALAQQTPQDAFVVATDAPAGMAELARERARRRGVLGAVRGQHSGTPALAGGPGATLRFAQAMSAHLPFGDGVFDLVVSAGAMHQWPNAETVLAQVRRVLAPHGRYLIADLRRDVSLPLWLAIRIGQRLIAPRDLQALDEPSASLRAAYAPQEAEWLAARSKLPDLHVSARRAWIMIERRAVLPETARSTQATISAVDREP